MGSPCAHVDSLSHVCETDFLLVVSREYGKIVPIESLYNIFPYFVLTATRFCRESHAWSGRTRNLLFFRADDPRKAEFQDLAVSCLVREGQVAIVTSFLYYVSGC